MFYNDRASFPTLLQLMSSEAERTDEDGALAYHNNLVELLAACTEGKNVYTEIKCNSLLPLDDIVKVVTHDDCIPEVSKISYAQPDRSRWCVLNLFQDCVCFFILKMYFYFLFLSNSMQKDSFISC